MGGPVSTWRVGSLSIGTPGCYSSVSGSVCFPFVWDKLDTTWCFFNPKSVRYTCFHSLIHNSQWCWLCNNHYWEKSRQPACCHANGVTELVTSVWACFVWLVECHRGAYTLYIRVKGGFSRFWGEGKIGMLLFLFWWGVGTVLSLCPKILCIKPPEVSCGCVCGCVCLYTFGS